MHNHGALLNRHQRITAVIFNGLPMEGKNNRYEKITRRFKTGKVKLTGYATLIFHEEGVTSVHSPLKKEAPVNTGSEISGVDKGYSEALEGWVGRKRFEKRIHPPQLPLNSIICREVRVIFSKLRTVRKRSAWCKGEILQALTEIAARTGSILKMINPAYPSPVAPLTGTLWGTRTGDGFIRYTGEVIPADYNAAINSLARDKDQDINRFMPSQPVKGIRLKCTAGFIDKMKLGGGVPLR